jgi:hypothetical protein
MDVLDQLERGNSTAVVGCHYGVNKSTIFSSVKVKSG